MFSAQRAWWHFRALGHDRVSVLDGGMQKWIREDGPTTAEIEDVPEETYKATFIPHLYTKYEDIENNLKDSTFQLVDARPEGRFNGVDPEPEKGVKSGCILGSTSIPFTAALDLENFCMKSPEELVKVFADRGIDINAPLVATCGYGITACVLALAAHECGNDKVGVYNGSWTEWYLNAPDELKTNVPSK